MHWWEVWYWRLYDWRVKLAFKGRQMPHYARSLKTWGVEGVWMIETGRLDSVLADWLCMDLVYHYHNRYMNEYNYFDHEHYFENVVREAASDPTQFSYHDFESEYSPQQLAVLDRIKEQYTVTPDPFRWAGFELPKQPDGLVIVEETMREFKAVRDYDQAFRQIQPPFNWVQHDQLILIPDPIHSRGHWAKHLTVFGQRLVVPGEFVLVMHCDDFDAPIKKLSKPTDAEIALMRQEVKWDGRPIDWEDQVGGIPRYQLDEFDSVGLVYRFETMSGKGKRRVEQAQTLNDVFKALVHDPKHFSIAAFADDYNAQERAFIDAVRQRYLTPREPDRWGGFRLPDKVPGAFLNLYGDSLGQMRADREHYFGLWHVQAPFKWYRHDHLLILPDPVPDAIREQGKKVVAFGQTIEVPGSYVMFMHVDDWDATPRVVSEMSEAEFASVVANVTINGIGNLKSTPHGPVFLDQIIVAAKTTK